MPDFYAIHSRNFQAGLRDALIGAPAVRPDVLAYTVGYGLGQRSPETGRSWYQDLDSCKVAKQGDDSEPL